jgi:hypothetical protein
MDLNLYFRVIWRFRFLVLGGLVLALVLGFFAMARVSFAHGSPKISYRQKQTWVSSTTLDVTQAGFPEGYTVFPYQAITVPGTSQPTFVSKFADPTRFSDLALYYSSLANSDAVQRLLYSHGPIGGFMVANPVNTGPASRPLPTNMISITGTSHSRARAGVIANKGSAAFMQYLSSQQAAAGVPTKDRVIVKVLNSAGAATLVTKRKKTIPIVVFITVLIATLGLAFILENLRPRVKPVEAPVESLEQALETSVSSRSA